MNIGGNQAGALPDLPRQPRNLDFNKKTQFAALEFLIFFADLFSGLIFSSPAAFVRIPGSEPIHRPGEAVFVNRFKGNLDFRPKFEKSLPYKI